jgi:hypothetical protein
MRRRKISDWLQKMADRRRQAPPPRPSGKSGEDPGREKARKKP